MNRKIIVCSLILFSALAITAPALVAQDINLIRDKVEVELRLTDEVITRARETVRTSNAPAPSLVLEQAISLQKLAWDSFNNGRLILAREQTLKARELAKQALSGSRLLEQGQDAVQNRLERAEELLSQAREEMPANEGESLKSLFETARRNLAQAWEFYRNGQYRPAVKMANQVEKAAKRLLQIANRQENLESNFERRLEALKQFIQRVQEEANNCQSEQARNLVEKAEDALNTAVDMSAKGQHERASRQLQQARKLATEAADLCGRAKDLTGSLEQLSNEAERLKDQIRPSDQTGMRLLDQIFEQLENARSFISRNESEGAAAALRAAQLTMKQLQRYLTSGEF